MYIGLRLFVWFAFFSICATGLMAQDTHKSHASNRDVKLASVSSGFAQCLSGFADVYPCQMVDMMSFLSVSDLNENALTTNDIWGWTDPDTGVEYALVGMNNGTSFVDISDPLNPVVVGFLPTHSSSAIWRDIKVYANHAFIVADNAPLHGVQVFDLTQLRTISSPPQVLQETVHYDDFGTAHNIVINEDSGYAYAVGVRGSGTTCGGGLHMIDISTPTSPTFAGCFTDASTGGYTHDAQCVMYHGPDTEHAGREICIGSNVNAISIADVTDKQTPVALSTGSYPESNYIHQGWLSEDHRYFFLDDELDELSRGLTATRTIVWDLEDLDDPVVLTVYEAPIGVTDHNQYVKGNRLYQSNYDGGLRILDISDPAHLVEIAFFDTRPNTDEPGFDGSWSNYPYFESGLIAITSIDEGFFLLKSNLVDTANDEPALPASMVLSTPYPNPFQTETTLSVAYDRARHAEVEVYDLIGRRVAVLLDDVVPARTPISLTLRAGDLPDGAYFIRASAGGQVETRMVTLIR